MPSIQFSGIASGLDTAAIIDALVNVERIPLQRLEAENSNYRAQISIFDNMSSSLSSLKSASEALATTGEFLSYTGTSSDDSVATITPSGDAIRGTYSLEVSQLAAAQRTYSTPIAAKDAALSANAETLSFTVDGNTVDVAIDANATLEDVVGAINAADAGVSAGLLYDGNQYRLQVVGDETGAVGAVTFADTGLGLDLANPANTVQAAQDAQLKLDGFDITSATNKITELLPGVSLEIHDTTVSPIELEIEPDSTAVKEKINGLISAYNDVFGIINAQSGEGKGENTLNGDSTVRYIEQRLQQMISSPIPGLVDGNGDELALGRLGFTTATDGTLTLDDADLDELLAQDFDSVARFFVGDPQSDTPGISGLLSDFVEELTRSGDGLISIRKDGIESSITNNDGRIEDHERYLERYESNLRDQYTALEQTMSALQSQQAYLAQFLL